MLLDRSSRDLSAVNSSGMQAVNAGNGSVAFDFPLVPVDSRWVDRSYYGLAGEADGSLWVSGLLVLAGTTWRRPRLLLVGALSEGWTEHKARSNLRLTGVIWMGLSIHWSSR